MTIRERIGRPRMILGAFGALSAVVLAFIPLFNMVGYESAAFYGVLFGITLSFLGHERFGESSWARALSQNLVLLVPPFLILTLNALRVRNCDFTTGAAFWLAIPVMSIAVATTWGWFVSSYTQGRRKLRYLLTAGFVLLTIIDFTARLALQPPIIGFHVFLGYFSGSIYDEALSLPNALVAYRVGHLFLIATLITTVGARRRHAASGQMPRQWIAAAVVCFIGMTWMVSQRHHNGIDLTRDVIADALGGRIETEHFVIYYPAEAPYADQIGRIAQDHEFRYAEMEAYFGTDPVELHGEKVRSFVYPNRDRKGDLMGARRTLVAKIWLREIHILWRWYGDHMLAHELAHVFTEPFGSGPLRLSTRFGVFPNMGLVEGIATAADWDAESLNPHEASAALRRMNGAPDIAALVGAEGFWTQSSGRAYTLMGSFVRWLVAEYGIEKFREAYPTGDFRSAYGKSPADLVEEWEAFVDAIDLNDEELERARYIYDRKSIFQKVCARTIAELRVAAQRSSRAGDRRAARELYERILAFDPDNPRYRIDYARFLYSMAEYDDARAALEHILAMELDVAMKAEVLALLGDLLWVSGNPTGAAARYEECLDAGLPVSSERLLRVKSIALRRSPQEAELARMYLVDDVDDTIRMFFPTLWVDDHPDEPLADYLVGRRLWGGAEWSWAEPYLRRSLEVPAGVLRDEATLMLVQTLFFQEKLDAAAALLRGWSTTDGHYEILKEEWGRRVDWSSRNTLDAKAR